MNKHYTYFLILAASLIGPLFLSFDKKVAFYTKWKYVFAAMVFPAMFYIIWDSYFTYKGIWSFNEKYNIGFYIYNLPIEEILFFIVVPYCCVFIYECIRCYFPNVKGNKQADLFLKILAVVLFIAGIIFYKKQYSSYTFVLNAIFIFVVYKNKTYFKTFDATSFLLAYAICLIPFLLVNGFLTALPVVIYNHSQNFNIRIYTIPFEDAFYGMLLIFINIALYEKFKNQSL